MMFFILVCIIVMYGIWRLIKWIIRPANVYRWGNDIYVSRKKLTAKEMEEIRKRKIRKRKK